MAGTCCVVTPTLYKLSLELISHGSCLRIWASAGGVRKRFCDPRFKWTKKRKGSLDKACRKIVCVVMGHIMTWFVWYGL